MDSTVGDRAAAREVLPLPVRAGTPTDAGTRVLLFLMISDAAKSHHDQLFGDRVSALAQSDPALTGYFGNFAFGEVHADAARLDQTLDLRTRLMVQLAAILAAGGLAEFRVVAAAAVANGGVSPVELKEIVYQSVAYVG